MIAMSQEIPRSLFSFWQSRFLMFFSRFVWTSCHAIKIHAHFSTARRCAQVLCFRFVIFQDSVIDFYNVLSCSGQIRNTLQAMRIVILSEAKNLMFRYVPGERSFAQDDSESSPVA